MSIYQFIHTNVFYNWRLHSCLPLSILRITSDIKVFLANLSPYACVHAISARFDFLFHQTSPILIYTSYFYTTNFTSSLYLNNISYYFNSKISPFFFLEFNSQVLNPYKTIVTNIRAHNCILTFLRLIIFILKFYNLWVNLFLRPLKNFKVFFPYISKDFFFCVGLPHSTLYYPTQTTHLRSFSFFPFFGINFHANFFSQN